MRLATLMIFSGRIATVASMQESSRAVAARPDPRLRLQRLKGLAAVITAGFVTALWWLVGAHPVGSTVVGTQVQAPATVTAPQQASGAFFGGGSSLSGGGGQPPVMRSSGS